MPMTDRKIDFAIAGLLRAGVVLSAAVVLAGGIGYLAMHAKSTPDYRVFTGASADLRSVAGVIGGAFHGNWTSIIQLGLLLLVATPIARVAFAVAAFALERDRLYVCVTLVVLAILVSSLMGLSVAPG